MVIKLKDFEFSHLPDVLTIDTGERIIETEIPYGPTLLEDLGEKVERFSLSGILENMNEWERLKELRRKEVILRIGELRKKVRIKEIRGNILRRGRLRYTITMVESKKEGVTLKEVHPKKERIYNARKEAEFIRNELMRRRLDPLGELNMLLFSLEKGLLRLEALLSDVFYYAELPLNLRDKVSAHLSYLMTQGEYLKEKAESVIDKDVEMARRLREFVFRLLDFLGVEKREIDALPKRKGTYIVKANETLQSIAVKEYGDVTRWVDIAEVNGIDDPGSVKAGQKLELPV